VALVVLAAPDREQRGRDALAELLAIELLERDREGAEPLLVVPARPEDWQPPELEGLRGAGVVDGTAFEALADAVDRGLRHLARARVLREQGDSWRPALVLAPVIVGDGPEPFEAVLAELDRLRGLLAQVFDRLTLGRDGLEVDAVHVVPWIWLPGVPTAWPKELFTAPRGYLRGALRPIVYTPRTERGKKLRSWHEYGRVRLLTDLAALRALSAQRPVLEGLFPQRAREHHVLWRVHSALYEYPLDERLRRARLEQLLASSQTRAGVLPDPLELGSLVAAQDEGTEPAITRLRNAIDSEIRTGLEGRHFAFGADFEHQPAPDFTLAPDRADRPRWTRSGWSLRAPHRQAGRLHREVTEALRACADGDLQKELDAALRSAMKQLRGLRDAVEQELTSALAWQEVEHRERMSGTSAALARVLSLSRGLDRVISDLEEDMAQKPADAERVLRRFERVLDRWRAKEDTLWREAREIGSDAAVWLEVGSLIGAGIAVGSGLAATVIGVILAPVPVAAGLGAAWYVHGVRQKATRQWFERWEMLEHHCRAEADDAAAELVAIVNHRIGQLKLVAVRDLRRSLRALEARFRTEVLGFLAEVEEERTIIERLERERERDPADAVSGRFRVKGTRVKASALDEADFHRKLAAELRRVLKLDGMPERIPLRVHHGLLSELVDRDLSAVGKDLEVDDEASEVLQRAARHGWSDAELSELPGTQRLGEPVHLAFVGARLPARVGQPSFGAATTFSDTPGHERIARSVPAEHALFVQIEQRLGTHDG